MKEAFTVLVEPLLRFRTATEPSMQPSSNCSSLSLKTQQLICVCRGTNVTNTRFRMFPINSSVMTSTDTAPVKKQYLYCKGRFKNACHKFWSTDRCCIILRNFL